MTRSEKRLSQTELTNHCSRTHSQLSEVVNKLELLRGPWVQMNKQIPTIHFSLTGKDKLDFTHICLLWKWKSLSCVPTLCDPMDCTVPGILPEYWRGNTFPFFRRSSQPRDPDCTKPMTIILLIVQQFYRNWFCGQFLNLPILSTFSPQYCWDNSVCWDMSIMLTYNIVLVYGRQ